MNMEYGYMLCMYTKWMNKIRAFNHAYGKSTISEAIIWPFILIYDISTRDRAQRPSSFYFSFIFCRKM